MTCKLRCILDLGKTWNQDFRLRRVWMAHGSLLMSPMVTTT